MTSEAMAKRQQQQREEVQHEVEVAAPPTREQDLPANDGSHDQQLRKMLNEAQLLALLPFSRRTLYGMMKRNQFPKGSFISEGRRIWFLDEIIGWQRSIEANDPLRGLRQKRRK
jgi:predicted DNA-binding transcriptional regulator AlpA